MHATMPSFFLFSFRVGSGARTRILVVAQQAFHRLSHLPSLFCILHDIIWVPRSLPPGETFVLDDISLIKGSVLGAWLLPLSS